MARKKITQKFIEDFIAGKVRYPARDYRVRKYNEAYWRVWDTKNKRWVDDKISRVLKRTIQHAEYIQLLADALEQGAK